MLNLEHGPENFQVYVSSVGFGSVAFLGVAGEPFTEVGRLLKKGSQLHALIWQLRVSSFRMKLHDSLPVSYTHQMCIRDSYYMLVTLNDVLIPAKKGKYAVGLFNAVNLELARGIIAAAEETGSPVIMGTAEVLFPYGPLDEVSYYLIPMAKKAKVPVVDVYKRQVLPFLNADAFTSPVDQYQKLFQPHLQKLVTAEGS